MSEEDNGNDGNAPERWLSRPLAETLHDLSLRRLQRAGRYVIEDEHGHPATYLNMSELDRSQRRCEEYYDAMSDIFEQKVLWMRRVLKLVFEAAGEWELQLLLPNNAFVVVALGNIKRGEFETMGQDVPAYQIPNLIPLIQRTERQIRLRNEYRHHLS